MRRLLIAILVLLAVPTMIHLSKMELVHGLSRMDGAHSAAMPLMPECPIGYVCPVKADSAPRLVIDAGSLVASIQAFTTLIAISLLLAFAFVIRYRPPFAVPIPSDPRVALSTFKRE